MADTNKTVKAAKAAEAKAETAAKKVEEAAKKAAEEATAETAPAKKAPAKRTAAKKTSTAKTTAAKKTTTRKTTKKAAPVEPDSAVIIQFDNKNVAASALVNEVKEIWAAEGKDPADLKDIKVYLNVPESKAYYVVNGDPAGVIEL